MGRGGAEHAKCVVVDPRLLMPIPDKLSFEQAAATPNVLATARDALVINAHIGKIVLAVV